MASKFRNLFDSDVQNALSNVPVAPEPAPIDIPRAQALARSSNNPQAQQAGNQMLEEDERRRQQAARQAEIDARKSAREAEKAQREQAKADEEIRQRGVREDEAAGMKVETNVETGKRSIATHPDGAPVFKAGPLGDPKQVENEKPKVQNIDGTVQDMPASNPLIPGDGALGATGGETKAVFKQEVRDDRGNRSLVDPDSKTDPKTGIMAVSKTDPTTGQTVKLAVGVDEATQAKLRKDEDLERRRQEIDLRDNAVKQTNLGFKPKWEPVKKEFDDASRELNSFNEKPKFIQAPDPKNPNNKKWFKRDPDTDLPAVNEFKQPVAYDPAELVKWQKDQADLNARHERAKQAHDSMLPTAENLNRNEVEITDQRLKLAEEKIRHDSGLPDDDGGIARILANDMNEVATLPEVEAANQVVGQSVTQSNETPQQSLEPQGKDDVRNPSFSPEKPLVPADDAGTFASAFEGLSNPSQFTVGDRGDGWRMIRRNGANVGSIEDSGGTPVVVLNAGPNEDLRGIASLGGTKGVPVYLTNGKRQAPAKEAEWAKQAFQTANQAMALPFGLNDMLEKPGTVSPMTDISAQLKDMGADLPSIIDKVKRGELSIQVGEAMAKNIYGETLKAGDPLKPEAFAEYIAANPEQQKALSTARQAKDHAAEKAIVGSYVSDWYAKNQHKPGVTWEMQQAARKALEPKDKSGAKEKAKGVGESLLDAGGSMIGLLSAATTLFGLGGYAAVSGDEDAGKAFWEMTDQRGRADKNFVRGLETNRQKWLTDEGKQKFSELDKALGDLRATNTTRDVYPDGVKDPRWKADVQSKMEAVTDAALALHSMNQEDGWEMTRDDVDANKNRVLKATLGTYLETGDPDAWQQFQRRLLLDKGSLQSEQYNSDLTQGSGRFASAVIGGATASDFETVTELLSDVLTFGAAKAITVGGKVLKAESVASKFASAGRLARFGEKAAQEFHQLGMVADTLANPASKLGKATNYAVKGTKAGLVHAATEGGEEALSAIGDRTANLQSVAEQAGMGGLMGLVLAPLMVVPSMAVTTSQQNHAQNQRVKSLVDTYNQAGAADPDFKPIGREQALAAMQLADNPARMEASDRLEAAKAEIRSAQAELAGSKSGLEAVREDGRQAAVAVPGDQNADTTSRTEALQRWQEDNAVQEQSAQGRVESAASRYSQAVAAYGEAANDMTNILGTALEVAQTTQDMTPAQRAEVIGLAKVGFGRPDLLSSTERGVIAGRKTREGLPYFEASSDVLTEAGRAEIQADFPLLGRHLATPESAAAFEASKAAQSATPQSNVTNPQGQPAGESQSQAQVPVSTVPTGTPGAANAGQVGSGFAVSGPAQAQTEAAVTPNLGETGSKLAVNAPAGPNLAAMDAGEYAVLQQSDPATPPLASVVKESFTTGRPVSVSMAKAAEIDIPDGYTKQGAMWNPPAQPASQESPVVANETAENVSQPDLTAENARQAAPAPAVTGAAGKSPAPPLVQEALGRAAKRFPGLAATFDTEETEGKIRSGGAYADAGKVTINLPDLQRELAGYAPAKHGERMDAVIDEEVVHLAQYEAVKRMGGNVQKFYGALWNEFTPAQRKAAANTYQADFADKEPWQQAAETVRMLIQQRADGRVTELTKAFSKNMTAELVAMLKEAVAYLKSVIEGGEISTRIQSAIEGIEAILDEYKGASSKPAATEESSAVETKTTDKESLTVEAQPEATPLQSTGQAITSALERYPNLAENRALKIQLYDLTADLAEVVEGMPAAERRAFLDQAIGEWAESLDLDGKAKEAADLAAKDAARAERAAAAKNAARTRLRDKARTILNSDVYPALSAIFEKGQITPKPQAIPLILARKKAGKKLTEKEMDLLRNLSEWDGMPRKSDFAGGGNNVVIREILDMLMAQPGEGQMPNVVGDGLTRDVNTASEMWEKVAAEFRALSNGKAVSDSMDDPNREWSDEEIAAELEKNAPVNEPTLYDARFEASEAFGENSDIVRKIDILDEFSDRIDDETFPHIMAAVQAEIGRIHMEVISADEWLKRIEPFSPTAENFQRFLDTHTPAAMRAKMESLPVIEPQEQEMALASSPAPTGRQSPVDIPAAVIAHDLGSAVNHPDYAAAKAGDPNSALRLARDMVTPKMRADVKAMIGDSNPVIVPVNAIEAGGNNMIPLAVSVRLAETLGLQQNDEIIQSVKANRSDKSALDRVFAQPSFEGPVIEGQTYLLVDDTLTQGGTFAALADHIIRNGGEVVGAVALTGKQYSANLRLSEPLLAQLRSRLGDLEDTFKRATGHGFDRLTESEARTLVKFGPVERVRERIAAEGNERGRGLDAIDGGQAPSPLGSSPTGDLFATPGPLAKFKENAQAAFNAKPEGSAARENIAREVLTREGVKKPGGFVGQAQRALDFGTSGSFSTRQQPGFDFNPSNEAKKINISPTESVEQAAAETDTNPTEAQIEAGNYRKGKVTLHGMNISIENPQGSVRRGTDEDGKAWETEMKNHYGYFLGTIGRDKDHVDVFIGPVPGSERAFVVNQVNPKTGRFDEHKVMLGFVNRKDAIAGYLANYQPGWKGLGDMVEADVASLKSWLDDGKTATPAKASDFATKPEPKPAAKPETGIKDFGEKIGGAKKDLWSGFRDSLKASLPDNMADFTMAKNFPEPNWQKLIESGVTTDNVAALKAIRDMVPRKPGSNYRIERWAGLVKALHGMAQGIASGRLDMASEVAADSLKRHPIVGRQVALYQSLGMPAILGAKEWALNESSVHQYGDIKAPPGRSVNVLYAEHKGRGFYRENGANGLSSDPETLPRIVDFIRSKIEADSAKEPAKKQTEFNVFRERYSTEHFIGKRLPGRPAIRLKAGFESAKDAFDYLKENRATLESQWEAMRKDPVMRNETNMPRKGAERRDGDVTPEQFQAAFGFRGVEFGNWVAGNERQGSMNEAFDALSDLAEVLGVPTRALSLDGSLGLAFGARGGGKYAAHYEPGKVVINLTKTKGAGALAHEWFHGLDNYFARFDKTGNTAPLPLDRMATKASEDVAKNVRPEAWAAFKGIKDALAKSSFAKRSESLDATRQKPYYGTTVEMAARAFEQYVVDRLAESNSLNDYLANISRNSEAFPTAEEMAGGIKGAYDNLFNTLETESTDTGVRLFASPSADESAAVQSALEAMPPIYRQVFEAVSNGATPAEVMSQFPEVKTARAITNILDQVRARIQVATRSASAEGLKPEMQDGKFTDGRPDLAYGANPTMAAIDKIRNESGVPDVRGRAEVIARAEAMLESDYQGTYDSILEAAKNNRQLLDHEVAAAKIIMSREMLRGASATKADLVKLGMLGFGYREIGTETARSLAMRFDPHLKPAERHAQFIAEALTTPDADTRARMRKAPKAEQQSILERWLERTTTIKDELLAQGINLDEALAKFAAQQEAMKQAEVESPRMKAALDATIRKLSPLEKNVVESIRSGALVSNVKMLTGLPVGEIKEIWTHFVADFEKSVRDGVKRFMEQSLASSPTDLMAQLKAEFGIYDWDVLDDTKPGFVDRREEIKHPRKPRPAKPKSPKAPQIPELTPEQQAALDEAFERFQNADPSTWDTLFQTEAETLTPMVGQVAFEQWKGETLKPWRDLWQTEMDGIAAPAGRMTFEEWIAKPENIEKAAQEKDMFPAERLPINETTGTFDTTAPNREGSLFPQPINETTGEWDETRPFTGQGSLIREGINETTGSFDIHDPVAVKRVLDAFAVARGTKMDAIMEFWRMSVLSGPQTHIVNFGSNVLNAAFNLLPRRMVEATINNVLGLVGQNSEKAATLGEFVPMAKNLRTGVQLAARNALRSWQAEARTFEHYASAEAMQLDFTGVGSEYIPPALGGKFGKIMRSLSFRAMTAADEFMKSAYGQMEAAAQSHRIAAVEEKLTGDAYAMRMDELMTPGSEAWIRSIDEAKRITFQEDLDGTNPRAIRRLDQFADIAKKARAMPWIGRPLTFFLPFIDTPTNVFKIAVEMSPLGGFLAVVDGTRALKRRIFSGTITKEEAAAEAAVLYDRARFVRDLTNQTIAWTTFFALQGLVGGDDDDELPVITGTVPYKTTKRGERDNAFAVMPPQTIRLGDKQFSYARIEPFATVLASTADLIQSMNRNGGLKPGVASEWLMRFKDSAKDKTFLQGVSNLLNALEDPDRFAERLAANIATGFVPNIIRQPIREADTTIRDGNPRATDGFMTSIAKRIGFSLMPQAAPAKIDVWGNPIQANRGELVGGSVLADQAFRIFDPLNVQVNPQADPIDRWIFLYNQQTADSKDRVGIEPISDKISIKLPNAKRSEMVPLSEQEWLQANQAAGKAAREALAGDWKTTPLTEENAKRITDTVRRAQDIERARLRVQKITEKQ